MKKKIDIIENKVRNNKRISTDDALFLYENVPLGKLGSLANFIKNKLTGNEVYFNRNIHIEPTNICLYRCKFCSFSKDENDSLAWNYTHDDIISIVKSHIKDKITEIHITGGVYPKRDINWFTDLFFKIKETIPQIHIKAFTAIELEYLFRISNISLEVGLKKLIEAGLNSLAGGGAEIFDNEIRMKLCPEKGPAEIWLNIHETAHKLGLSSNATMLYGHIENYQHRVIHINELRNLQDKTNGFNAFIPLKFRKQNNFLSYLPEISIVEDLRNFAVARIFLDNIKHIKAYWPMFGKENARLALHFGADDFDGTIYETTKIYSLAGSEEQTPVMSPNEINKIIEQEGFVPVERNSLYEKCL